MTVFTGLGRAVAGMGLALVILGAGARYVHAAAEPVGLSVGEAAPDFEAKTYDGNTIRLADLRKTGPVVLVFYRGAWCPFCNLHLKAFQRKLDDFKAAGVEILAISVDPPQASARTVQKNDLGFEVISEAGEELLRSYKVTAAKNGRVIAAPATFVIDSKGSVIYSYGSHNPAKRSDPAKVLEVVRSVRSASDAELSV